MGKQYILYEHAGGYALFIAEADGFATQAGDLVSDVNKFKEVCKFVAFKPFTRAREALENINSISEGVFHPDLEEFLTSNLTKKKYVLGVEDTKLIEAMKEKLQINCNLTDDVRELIRGIRFHFHKLVPGFPDLNAATKVQLGLAHAYSRTKVKFNVGRVDNMIIQTITLLDQLDKDINSLTMRIREWYSHHFPELIKIVSENTLYIQCLKAVGDRKNMPEDALEQLQNILNDPNQAQNIIELARTSMGMEMIDTDLKNMYYFVERVIALTQRRKDLTDYLKSKMSCVAPNLAALIGEFVGARLIAQAGSLTNLAKAPASTVQILGAEKALFRALKTRGNTPKYGIIFHSTFIGKAAKVNKGRISRYLANKCSVASRIDCFGDIPTDVFGSLMKEQVEERLKFYVTGQIPEKNTDIMDRALQQIEISQREMLKKMKIESKKAKKRKLEELYLPIELDQTMAALAEGTVTDELDTSMVKKKKKKRKSDNHELNDEALEVLAESTVVDEADTSIVKKKKKRKSDNNHELNDETMAALDESTVADEADTSIVKKKKKKKSDKDNELNDETMAALDESTVVDEADTSIVKKKKKNRKSDNVHELNETVASVVESAEADTSLVKKKKKELNGSHELNDESMAASVDSTVTDEMDISVAKKNKKKKRDLNGSHELNGETMEALAESSVADEADTSLVKKKKKKKKQNDAEQSF